MGMYQLDGFRKSTPPHNQQVDVQQVDDYVEELTYQNYLIDQLYEIKLRAYLPPQGYALADFERGGNTSKGLEDFHLKARTRYRS